MKFTRRIRELATGHTVNWLITQGFDYVLYPFAIWKLGLLYGGAVMAGLSLVLCLLTLWFYDWSRRDWLGIEALKELRECEAGAGRGRRLLAWSLSRGDAVACVILSIKWDPFITTAYLRRGAFNGMSGRDWRVFLASWVIGNTWWALLCYAGVETLGGLWRWAFAA